MKKTKGDSKHTKHYEIAQNDPRGDEHTLRNIPPCRRPGHFLDV